VLLLCAPSSFDVTTYLTIQGDLTSFSSNLFPLFPESSLDTSFLMSHLFDELYSFALLFGTCISLTHPSGVVSILFILYFTTHLSPLAFYSLLLYSTFLLSSDILLYLSSLLLLYSSRSILSHLISFSFVIFPTPPPCAGRFTPPSYRAPSGSSPSLRITFGSIEIFPPTISF
jgi:hypothetical protein